MTPNSYKKSFSYASILWEMQMKEQFENLMSTQQLKDPKQQEALTAWGEYRFNSRQTNPHR